MIMFIKRIMILLTTTGGAAREATIMLKIMKIRMIIA